MPTDRHTTSTPEQLCMPTVFLRLGVLCGIVAGSFCLGQQSDYDAAHLPAGNSQAIAARINVNEDPWWKIAALPNIGMVKSKRIVSFREKSGRAQPFSCADDLLQIYGIGPKTVAQLRPLLYFAPADPSTPTTQLADSTPAD